MKRGVVAAALVALSLAAMPVASLGADPETATMEKVVVTAGRVEEKAKNVTAAMTVIGQEEIEKNQYQNLGGLLRNYGVQVNGYAANGSLSQVAMRGVRTSLMGSHGLDGSILLLVDGRRVGTDNISMIPLVNVERIEIVRGPAAVQYGTSAVGGVINVITRRGTETPKFMAEAGIGSFEEYRLQSEGSWARGPFDFSGGVSYMSMDDYKYGSNRHFHNTGTNYKIGYNVNGGVSFLEEHRLGVTVIGERADQMGSPGYYNNPRYEYTDRSTHSIDLGYEGGYAEAGLSWKGRYFDGKNNYLSDEWNKAGSNQYYKSVTNYRGAQGQISFSKSILTLTGGMDWNKYDTRMFGAYYEPHEHSEYENVGLFLLGKLSFFDDLIILSGGVRYDEYEVKVQGEEKNLYRTTPSVGVAVNPTDWLTLRANYGESYRVPQAIELLGFVGMLTYEGNPDLKPEKGKSWDAGFEINHRSLNLGLTYFQTDYKNKISSRANPVTWAYQYYNMEGTVKLRGIEATASYDIGEAMDWPILLRPYANLTRMLKYEDHEGRKVKNISDLDVGYGLNFQHPGIGFEADLRLTYFGKQKVDDWNDVSETYGDEVRIGGRTVVDLFLSQTIKEWEEAGRLSVKAEVRNIGNDRYGTIKDYPQPGRSFYIGLRYDY